MLIKQGNEEYYFNLGDIQYINASKMMIKGGTPKWRVAITFKKNEDIVLALTDENWASLKSKLEV